MAEADINSSTDYPKTDYSGPLTTDHLRFDSAPEHSTVNTSDFYNLTRAADAVSAMARIVHNSLCEPFMSGAEPLGHASHTALLGGIEVIGKYVSLIVEHMQDTARMIDKLPASTHHAE